VGTNDVGKTNVYAEPGKHDVRMTRVFDAPPALVYRAWTDPALVRQWMGPARLTWTACDMDVRPGGSWRWVQTDDSGSYGFHGVYHDVAAPERIVQTFEFEGAPGHVSLESALFEPQGGKTLVTMHSVYQSVEDRDAMAAAGMEEGMNEGFDRLDAILKELQKQQVAAR
jgi:uncharacterized protein YndB with AHSA1/START domain